MRKQSLTLIIIALLLMGCIAPWVCASDGKIQISTLSAYWTNPVYASNPFMLERGFSSRFDLWRTGYLSLFFHPYWFGYVAWLAVPMTLYFALTWRRRQRWERALATVWLLVFITVAVKGYYNERYAMTIFPLTIAGALWLAWEGARERGRWALVLLGLTLIVTSFYRCGHAYRSHFVQKVWQAQWVSIPQSILTFCEKNDPANGLVLVCKQPFFYYYTSWNGLDYQHPFIRQVSRAANPEEALRLLKERRVAYVLVSRYFEESAIAPTLKHVFTILKKNGVLLEDEFDCRLYALPP